MTLPDILREALVKLGDIGCDHVSIARAGEHAYQYRFSPDRELERGYRLEGRRWMDGTELTPTSGTEKAYVGWARWSRAFGFNVDAVLADDWRFIS